MTETVQVDNYCVQTRELNLWYGDFHALKGIDASIKHGIITALIGPSGCGKTTLLRCFNRLNERFGNVRTQGTTTILGKNIYDPDVCLEELRKSVGMVFQRPNPLPISIYENIVFGLRVHSRQRSFKRSHLDEIVEAALKEVFLWDELNGNLKRKATRLTLEQQQKLCIARLIPIKPQVILMDEPCSALDAQGTAAIETLMDSLRGKYTIIVVTHNMAQARRASDECIYMLMGKLIEHAATTKIFLNPQHKETEMYIEGRYG